MLMGLLNPRKIVSFYTPERATNSVSYDFIVNVLAIIVTLGGVITLVDNL